MRCENLQTRVKYVEDQPAAIDKLGVDTSESLLLVFDCKQMQKCAIPSGFHFTRYPLWAVAAKPR